MRKLILIPIPVLMLLLSLSAAQPARPPVYRSPADLAFSPDGGTIAIADHTAGEVVLLDAGSRKVRHRIGVARPVSVVWSPDSAQLYVADYDGGDVAHIDVKQAKVVRRLPGGPYLSSAALAAKRNLLLTANSALGDITVVDLASGKEKARIKAVREPFWIAVTPDESMAVVSNLLPDMPASDPRTTACITLLDLSTLQKIKDIPLPPNASSVRQVAISPDGQWAYTVHTVGRTGLPATQLDRGWVNTNALSIIDLKQREHFATLLLDSIAQGAADPWGITLNQDGSTMFITIAGTHQLARIDLARLHRHLAGKFDQPPRKNTIWATIQADASKRADLVNDLAALYAADLIQRIPLPGKGPRGISLAPDGKTLAIGMYFSGEVLLVDPASPRNPSPVAIGPQPPADQVRMGRMIFHDATYAFQQWLSCATCHPNDGRVDALNWDLPNDGIGNPKNVRSLLLAHLTPPMMSLGVREDMEMAAAAGFRFASYQPRDEDVKAVQAYIRSLTPEKSPYLLPNGDLSPAAKRGKAIFSDEKVACAHCHSGELYTNLKQYDVGTQGPLDHKEHKFFDTPTLIELWRTAPYLHDGRALTLMDVLTTLNQKDEHGKTRHLSRQQLEDLVAYLLSL
jgi:DNA-binding beta-propeller fold protein YncE